MKVSQSKIKVWRRCHCAYYYKYILKLKKKLKSKPLMVGSIVHECIEAFLRGKKTRPIIRKYTREINSLFEEERIEFDDVIPLCNSLVSGYVKRYEEDGFKTEGVEIELLVPLMDGIEFTGKIDALVSDDQDKLWIMEHKTCRFIPDEANRMSDIQTVIYWWALPEAGYDKPNGVIWDYLRKKAPVVPEVLKKGGLSKKKNTDTTQEVYLKAIKDNDLDPADYTSMLESLRGREEGFFRRVKLPFSQKLMSQVMEDFKVSSLQLKKLGHLVKDRNMTRDCSWCDFFNLCQSDMRGLDTDFLIKKDYIIIKDKP